MRQDVPYPFHRLKHKYKEHDRMNHIVVSKAELPLHLSGSGWVTVDGYVLLDKQEAIEYAKKFNEYIKYLETNKKRKQRRF